MSWLLGLAARSAWNRRFVLALVLLAVVYLPEWLASFAERTGPPARGAPGARWG